MLFGSNASITWNECEHIKLSSLSVHLISTFRYSLIFEHSLSIQLANVSIYGSTHIGRSAIVSHHSIMNIMDCKFVNIFGQFGAVLSASNSVVRFIGSNSFTKNKATSGGVIHISDSELMFDSNFDTHTSKSEVMSKNGYMHNKCELLCHDNGSTHRYSSFVENQTAQNGGAVLASDSFIAGSAMFYRNFAIKGGAMHSSNTTLRFEEYTCFCNNTSKSGGALYLSTSNLFSHYSLFFVDNSATSDGGSISSDHGCIVLERNVTFSNGRAHRGGAISMLRTILYLNGSGKFWNNSANHGGALHMSRSSKLVFNTHHGVFPLSNTSFQHNVASEGGGSIRSFTSCNIQFSGNFLFHANSAKHGGALNIKDTIMEIDGYIDLNNNIANDGGAVWTMNSTVSFRSKDTFHISANLLHNKATYNGGSITSHRSQLQFLGKVVFYNNTAGKRGGALRIVRTEVLFYGSVSFTNNTADRGGAI